MATFASLRRADAAAEDSGGCSGSMASDQEGRLLHDHDRDMGGMCLRVANGDDGPGR
jgi:hypothetical protein